MVVSTISVRGTIADYRIHIKKRRFTPTPVRLRP
jgi:hypothetical protein